MSKFDYGGIFDMDGVLVDNAEYHTLAFEKWCEEKGISFDPDDFKRRIFGKQNRDIFEILLGRKVTDTESREWADEKEALYRKIYAPYITEVPGLARFLRELDNHGFGLAVATSGPVENVEFVQKSLGIEGLFDAVVTAADITRGKPDPQVFQLAMERLELPPSRCVVFEDSPSGAGAATASGAGFIGVATSHNQLPGASRMIKDFNELDVVEVIQLINKNSHEP